MIKRKIPPSPLACGTLIFLAKSKIWEKIVTAMLRIVDYGDKQKITMMAKSS
jgi:hypothetical protein